MSISGVSRLALQNQLPFLDSNLGDLRVSYKLTCPHPSGRNRSADPVVFQQIHQGHLKCCCSENPCSTECTNTCRDIRSGLRSRCRSFREINQARNKAGFGLERGKMWVKSICLVHLLLTENNHWRGHHPVYKVNAFGPTNENLVADMVQVTTAFWPRQAASHVPHT